MRRVWRLALIGLLLLTVLVACARWYWTSPLLAARVASKLGEMYGGQVTVGSAAVGTEETVLRDVCFFEPACPNRPWLTVERLDTDLAVAEFLEGHAPTHVNLHGVTVLLRFDDQGNLLTRLPSGNTGPPTTLDKLPAITLADAKLFCVSSDGRQLACESLNLKLTPVRGGATLCGDAVSAALGRWSLLGTLDAQKCQIAVTAATQEYVPVSQALLAQLPFLSPATWLQVQANGDTIAAVTLEYDWAKGKFNYDCELFPKATSLRVAAIDLEGDALSGRVHIADGQLWFQGIKGRTCDGDLVLDGHLDLTQPALFLELSKIKLAGVDLRRFPASWTLPSFLEGRIDAAFDLKVTGASGRVHLSGTGHGQARQARIAGVDAVGPVELTLRDTGPATLLDWHALLPPSELSVLAKVLDITLPADSDGLIEIDAQGSLPLDTIADWRTYQASAQSVLTDGQLFGLPLKLLTLPARVTTGKLLIDKAQATLPEGGTFTAQLQLGIEPPYAFHVALDPLDFNLAILDKLEPASLPSLPLAGRAKGAADFAGTLKPMTLRTQGACDIADADVGPWKASAVKCHWKSDYTWNGDGKAASVDIDGDASIPSVVVRGIRALDVAAGVNAHNGKVTYKVSGQAFNGTFDAIGELADVGQAGKSHTGVAKLHVKRMGLSRLAGLAGDVPLHGAVDGEMDLQFETAEFQPIGHGRLTASDVRWEDHLLTTRLQGEMVFDRKELVLQNVSASIAQGTAGGRLVLPREAGRQGHFRLSLDGANANELFAQWPSLAEHVQGTLDANVHGTLAQEWTGTADFSLQRGKILGVDVSDWRVPARWSLRAGDGQAQVDIRDSTAQVGQGRASAQASALWDHGLTMTGQVQFADVELKQALAGSKWGRSRATGRLDFSGDHMHGVDDLKASLIATTKQTQAFEFPIFRPLAPVLGLAPSTTFQSGDIKARLAKSVVYVEQLTMAEGPLQLYTEGTMTLQGRVNLDVTANVGKLTNIAAMLGMKLPALGPFGNDLLTKATSILSPKLVSAHVRGTFHEPRVEVVPLPQFTEQALRFFAGMVP